MSPGVAPAMRAVRGWGMSETHRQRLRLLGLVGYRRHDARHHWAVRMARSGAPLELIARLLGHRGVAMVAKVYARFKPDTEERDRWERIASTRDEAKWGRCGSSGGSSGAEKLEIPDEQSPATLNECEAFDDSRGGTRTRDPGIMSAVL